MGRPFELYSQESNKQTGPDSTECEEQINSWKQELQGAVEVTPDVEAFLRWYCTQKRTAYTMDVEPAVQPLSRQASKIGGLPFLLPGEAWPVSTQESADPNKELSFIWQFQVSDMPHEVQQLLGVHEGLLQFFLDVELPGSQINEDSGYYLVRILTPEQLGGSQQNSASPGTVEVLPEKAVLGWVPHTDWPSGEDACDRCDGLLDDGRVYDILSELHDVASCMSGDKLLGWPHWCQGPEWGITDDSSASAYLQLLQFEAEHLEQVSVGDSGTLVIQCHPTARASSFKVGWACC